MIWQMAAPLPVARLEGVPNLLSKIFPEPVDVIPILVTTTLLLATLVPEKPENQLLLIVCPVTVVEFKIPIIADPAGLPVSALAIALLDAVVRLEIVFPDMVVEKAPETLIPATCAFTPLETSEILLTRLFVIKAPEFERIPV